MPGGSVIIMGEFDHTTEKRIWERVWGENQPQSLQVLAAAEKANAAVYLRLARMAQGPEKAMLRQLFERERRHGQLLGGIHLLTTDKALSVRTASPAADPMGVALRKCYATTLKAIAEYERHSQDREYGPAFAQLAAQEREHCVMLLELLGSVCK